jgi:hypothetical protein
MATMKETRNVSIAGWLISSIKTILGCANAAESSANLTASQVNVWVDESGNTLNFQVKYSDNSTVKSCAIPLI